VELPKVAKVVECERDSEEERLRLQRQVGSRRGDPRCRPPRGGEERVSRHTVGLFSARYLEVAEHPAISECLQPRDLRLFKVSESSQECREGIGVVRRASCSSHAPQDKSAICADAIICSLYLASKGLAPNALVL